MVEEADVNKAFRGAVYPNLEKHYAEHLKAVLGLCFRAKTISADDRINFLYEFDQIVGGYKRRIKDPTYFVRMLECCTDLKTAAGSLESAIAKLAQLDAYHWDAVREEIANVGATKLLEDLSTLDFLEFLILFKRVAVLSASLSVALTFVGGENLPDRGPGNVPLPFLFPTIALIRFWKQWTGEEVPYAKAIPRIDKKSGKKNTKSGGQAGQSSTEFVRLALTLIDPTVTAANAITSINRARELLRLADEVIAQPPENREQLLQSIARSIVDKQKSKSIRPRFAE